MFESCSDASGFAMHKRLVYRWKISIVRNNLHSIALSPIEMECSQMNCIVWQTDNYSLNTVLFLYPLIVIVVQINENELTFANWDGKTTKPKIQRSHCYQFAYTLNAKVVIFGAHTTGE